jgi:glycosyltransferase involved in cell wall biosynthesis
MGCAVVTTSAGGIKEVVRHEEDGLVVDVDAWTSLGTILQSVAEDAVLRKRLAEAARTRVVEAFSLQRMVGDLEQLYTRVFSGKYS